MGVLVSWIVLEGVLVAGVLIGMALGLLIGALAAWWVLRSQVRFVRAAERRARAAERMAEIGSMTGGLAHEIRNPLSTIGLNAQLLAEAIDDAPLEAETRSRMTNRVAALRRETERLRGILQDFLEFAGQVRLDPAMVDVRSVVSELVDFYLPEAERHGVRLRADLPSDAVNAVIDAKLVKQALFNLVLNATQAIEGAAKGGGASGGGANDGAGGAVRGEIILRVETGVEDRTPVARVHVIDTGPGIPADVLPRVFAPYFTTKGGGTGLGLPTARRIVEEHGGRLEVHTEVGRGTDFLMVLPREPKAEKAPADR